MLGLAVGDALGVPAYGRPLMAPLFPQLAEGRFQDMRGGGPHALRRGQVTDNTQMACALASSLRELRRYDASDAARRYLALKSFAIALDEPTREVLEEMEQSPPATRLGAGRRVWLRHHRRSVGSACLPRALPLAVALADDPQALTDTCFEDTALTHFDPRCQLATTTLAATVAYALHAGPGLEPQDMLEAASSGLRAASARLGRLAGDYVQEITFASELLRADLAAAQEEDPQLYGLELHLHRHAGHLRVAFRLAYWELLHAPSFEAGVLDVVNRGGETTTNAAVAGSLLGALHGESAIPSPWRQTVLDALGTGGRPGVPGSQYHPRLLLPLAPE